MHEERVAPGKVYLQRCRSERLGKHEAVSLKTITVSMACVLSRLYADLSSSFSVGSDLSRTKLQYPRQVQNPNNLYLYLQSCSIIMLSCHKMSPLDCLTMRKPSYSCQHLQLQFPHIKPYPYRRLEQRTHLAILQIPDEIMTSQSTTMDLAV